MYGSREATVKLVMYSDTDCQYCRSLYTKLKNVVASYEYDQVALVYRHLPIYYFRGNIDASEYASECVFREKNDDGFFTYLDRLFAQLPVGVQTDNIDEEIIFKSGEHAGVVREVLSQCIGQEYGKTTIEKQHNSGGALGIIVIPHTFVVSDNAPYEIPQNQSESTFKATIDSILYPRN